MRNTIGPDVYTGFCLAHAPRVLGALDRNPLSPTFGCQDWRYWHDKVSDIPSGHDQEMIYFLALRLRASPRWQGWPWTAILMVGFVCTLPIVIDAPWLEITLPI